MRNLRNRDRHAQLLSCVRFANDENDTISSVPLILTRSESNRERLRSMMKELMRLLATHAAAAKASMRATYIDLSQPPLPDRLIIDGDELKVMSAQTVVHDVLVPALTGHGLRRLKLCPKCDKLFVALNGRAQTCSPECSNVYRQKQFYERHRDAEKERKLKQYHENRKRNQAARMARKQRRSVEYKPVLKPKSRVSAADGDKE